MENNNNGLASGRAFVPTASSQQAVSPVPASIPDAVWSCAVIFRRAGKLVTVLGMGLSEITARGAATSSLEGGDEYAGHVCACFSVTDFLYQVRARQDTQPEGEPT